LAPRLLGPYKHAGCIQGLGEASPTHAPPKWSNRLLWNAASGIIAFERDAGGGVEQEAVA